jgi:hypothetical protein
MKSKYVELMGARKQALRRGDEEKAKLLFDSAMALVEKGEVSEDEMLAGAYI